MSRNLTKAMNRLAAAIEKQNDVELQKKLAAVKAEALTNKVFELLDDYILVKKVTDVLSGAAQPPFLANHDPMSAVPSVPAYPDLLDNLTQQQKITEPAFSQLFEEHS